MSDSEEWYTASLRAELSQGDIIRLVPTGLIDDPITVCVPENAAQSGKANYALASQLTERSANKPKFLHARFGMGLGMVLWPDCQIDKQKNQKRPEREWIASVYPIRPLAEIGEEHRSQVAGLERAQWFPLPPHGAALTEPSFVDLRRGWPIRQTLLADRVLSLSDDARTALRLHLFWFTTELALREPLVCPHCQGALGIEEIFQRRNDE